LRRILMPLVIKERREFAVPPSGFEVRDSLRLAAG
jgi:hypothetical protein